MNYTVLTIYVFGQKDTSARRFTGKNASSWLDDVVGRAKMEHRVCFIETVSRIAYLLILILPDPH
jgi:hypothetical protein